MMSSMDSATTPARLGQFSDAWGQTFSIFPQRFTTAHDAVAIFREAPIKRATEAHITDLLNYIPTRPGLQSQLQAYHHTSGNLPVSAQADLPCSKAFTSRKPATSICRRTIASPCLCNAPHYAPTKQLNIEKPAKQDTYACLVRRFSGNVYRFEGRSEYPGYGICLCSEQSLTFFRFSFAQKEHQTSSFNVSSRASVKCSRSASSIFRGGRRRRVLP